MSEEKGKAAFEAGQKVFFEFELSAIEGICLAGDLLVWALLIAIEDKEQVLQQFELMKAGLAETIKANHPAVAARRALLKEMEHAGGNRWVQ